MQFKSLLVAVGFIAITTAVALPESQIEARAVGESAPFKIRRFSPLTGFNAADANTWSNNEYTNIATANAFLNYKGITAEASYFWTLDAVNVLRGSPASSGTGNLAARNLQSYEVTLTPIAFGGAGELAKVTVGPGPLFEVKFQTVRTKPVVGWTGLTQVGGFVFLGKASDIAAPIRFRAIGYTGPTTP